MTTTTARKSCTKCHATIRPNATKCPNTRCVDGPKFDDNSVMGLASLNGIGTEYVISLHPNDRYSVMCASGSVCNVIGTEFASFSEAVMAALVLIEDECADEGWGEDQRLLTSERSSTIVHDYYGNDVTIDVRCAR